MTMTTPHQETIKVIHGFHTRNRDRQVVVYGEEILSIDHTIVSSKPFSQFLRNADNDIISIKRAPNPGGALFWEALRNIEGRAHRRLAPSPQPVLPKTTWRALFQRRAFSAKKRLRKWYTSRIKLGGYPGQKPPKDMQHP